MTRALITLSALLCAGGAATANSVVVNINPGTTNTTSALTGSATTGAQMAGMRLTAHFSGGASEVVTWASFGGVSGGASGSGWSLSQAGDTFSNAWQLVSTSASLDRLVIDAGPGDTVFDTTFFGAFGTDGSALGQSFFVLSGGAGYDITATYFDAVAISGNAPVGDIYRFLEIDFTTRGIAFGPQSTLEFLSDTDNILFAGDIRPVPLPLTAGLAGAGLVAIGATTRRRQTAR